MKRISITGPESTGKSWLARKLAEHYRTCYVEEFARGYIDHLTRDYNALDIPIIAFHQLKNEQICSSSATGYLFCDTDLLVCKIWSLHKYGECHPWIKEKTETHRYDLHLLCNIDLPWQRDEQREHPDLREFFFTWYEKELKQAGKTYRIVSGFGDSRISNAIQIINEFYKK